MTSTQALEAATDALRDLEIKFSPPEGMSIRQATIAEAQRLVRERLAALPTEASEPVAWENEFAEYEGVTAKELAETVARYGSALKEIASLTQTERLLWWQIKAREALGLPVPQVLTGEAARKAIFDPKYDNVVD